MSQSLFSPSWYRAAGLKPRLRSHLEQLHAMIDGANGAVGRRLGFLVQELGRELNTVASPVQGLRETFDHMPKGDRDDWGNICARLEALDDVFLRHTGGRMHVEEVRRPGRRRPFHRRGLG